MSAAYQRLWPVALVGLAGMTASCALLVSYDGFRGSESDDAGAEAGGDATGDGGLNVCQGVVPGVYCARALPAYRGDGENLVQCLGNGTMGAVESCDAGCASMPDGRQDVCNACPGRPDGLYCLQEIVLTYPGNDVLVGCGAGITTGASLCPNGCVASACR